MNKMRKIFTSIVIAVLAGIVGCYALVSMNAQDKAFSSIADVPAIETGLLLGTSPITPQGRHNYYFDARIKATAELYHSGKIKKIIASGGDYSYKQNGCNELVAMRDSLVARCVPDSVIALDYEGLRTINSIVKAKQEYGCDSVVLISQEYHNERAIWLAEHYGLDAIAYNAVTPRSKRIKNIGREFFARVKLFLDLYVLKVF